jgi:hypothetical protein
VSFGVEKNSSNVRSVGNWAQVCFVGETAMLFDILFPSVLFVIIAASVLAYRRFESSITSLFEEKEFTPRDAVLMVAAMGIMVTAIVLIPDQAIQVVFIAAYSYMLFAFTYIALKKWYVAVLPPVFFVVSYFYFWHPIVFNLFVVAFAILISVYLSGLFSWKAVWIFAILLTIMDVIQVFVTRFMIESATKLIGLGLPVILILQTYPAEATMGLGLGDIFLSGLLAIQTAKKHGEKSGIMVAVWIGIAMAMFEIVALNTGFARFFPATVVVMAGWLAGVGFSRMLGSGAKNANKELGMSHEKKGVAQAS